jgi:hypothetical protein
MGSRKALASPEESVRAELVRSCESLFGGGNPALLAVLKEAVPGLQHAYVLDWIPEQRQVHNIHQYRRDHRRLGRQLRQKLGQALLLARDRPLTAGRGRGS